MKVENKIMYHIHKNNVCPEMWKVNNKFIVNDKYDSIFSSKKDIPSGVICSDDSIVPLSKFIKKVLDEMDTDEKLLSLKYLNEEDFLRKGKYLCNLLYDSMAKLQNLSIKNREEALEEIRKEKYNNLPSRYHSLFVCEKDQLEFWKTKLSRDISIYKLSLTGNLFKSSDSFLPNDGKTKEEQKTEADKYWNPIFTNEDEEKTAEYLFQGEVKILEEVK